MLEDEDGIEVAHNLLAQIVGKLFLSKNSGALPSNTTQRTKGGFQCLPLWFFLSFLPI
jgi:hypothetical protein